MATACLCSHPHCDDRCFQKVEAQSLPDEGDCPPSTADWVLLAIFATTLLNRVLASSPPSHQMLRRLVA